MNIRPAAAALLPPLSHLDGTPITKGYLLADIRRGPTLVWFAYVGDLADIHTREYEDNGHRCVTWTGQDHWHRLNSVCDQELTKLLVGDEPIDICTNTVWQIRAGAVTETPAVEAPFDPYKAILA